MHIKTEVLFIHNVLKAKVTKHFTTGSHINKTRIKRSTKF